MGGEGVRGVLRGALGEKEGWKGWGWERGREEDFGGYEVSAFER